MMSRTANDIKTEIIEIVMAFYYCANIHIYKKPVLEQLENINEIVAFVFENFVSEFNEILRRKTEIPYTEDGLITEKQLMISWISLDVLNELRGTEIRY